MKGQWLGRFNGSNGEGTILVNIDERENNYQGVAYVHPDGRGMPSSAAAFRTKNKDVQCQLRTDALLPFDPISATVTTWDAIKGKYPGVNFSQYADVSISLTNESLSLSWTTDLGATGKCELPRSRAGEPSDLKSSKQNWSEFKEHVAGLSGKRYLFRGQGFRLGKPCLVYLRSEILPIEPRFAERTSKSARKLEQFKNILKSRHVTATFRGPDDLALQVERDLSRLLASPRTERATDFEYFQTAIRGEEGDYLALIDLSSFLYDLNLLYEFSRVVVDPEYGNYKFSRLSLHRNNRVEAEDRL